MGDVVKEGLDVDGQVQRGGERDRLVRILQRTNPVRPHPLHHLLHAHRLKRKQRLNTPHAHACVNKRMKRLKRMTKMRMKEKDVRRGGRMGPPFEQDLGAERRARAAAAGSVPC